MSYLNFDIDYYLLFGACDLEFNPSVLGNWNFFTQVPGIWNFSPPYAAAENAPILRKITFYGAFPQYQSSRRSRRNAVKPDTLSFPYSKHNVSFLIKILKLIIVCDLVLGIWNFFPQELVI